MRILLLILCLVLTVQAGSMHHYRFRFIMLPNPSFQETSIEASSMQNAKYIFQTLYPKGKIQTSKQED